MTDQPTKPTLRELARRVGCTHSALSAAVHDGRLTAGVGIDARGRAMVTDLDAAARAWRAVHMPAVAKPREHAVLDDRALDRQVTAATLFAERDALSLLVTALAADANRHGIETRIAARLRDVAELHGADDHDIARAQADLASALAMLDEDEP